MGTVARDVAEDLGLSTDTVVITGIPDLHAAAIGSGATGLFEAHLALSTTSWISCPVPKKKTDALHSIAAVPGLTNDSYLIIDNQETGAKSLEWLRGLLAGTGTPMGYAEMTALAATSPPGANDVLFTPWLAGERSPIGNKHLRGGFTNLALTTTTADLVRAVLEGVAANSAWLLGYVEKFAGRELTPLRLARWWRAVERVVPDLRRCARSRRRTGPPADGRATARRGAPGRGRPRSPPTRGRRGPASARAHLHARTATSRTCTACGAAQFPSLYARDKKWSRHVS